MTALPSFTPLDWAVLLGYIALLAAAGWWATRRMRDAEDYFLASHHVPPWLIAVSVLSTNQSAATFLGAPDNSYRGNFTYLAASAAPLIAAFLVARYLIPRFYAAGVGTVYQLLEDRFDARARRAAAGMYLVGRILASGARLYLAAIAISMILFLDVSAGHVAVAAFVLLVLGLAFTLLGGLEAVIWSDLVQVVLYVGAALLVIWFLWTSIPASSSAIFAALQAEGKLRLIDPSFSWTASFSVPAILTGLVLLNCASAGLDQDCTQRLLACRDAGQATRGLYSSALIALPVVALFLVIGALLHIHYERPDLMAGGVATLAPSFHGEKITVFMNYILTEIPPGLRGMVVVGLMAAAAVNSELISMASVAVTDLYRPYAAGKDDQHFVRAGQWASIGIGLALFGTAVGCYFWQHSGNTPLLDFVLGIMSFAYSGLLGVYATALFTRRGTSTSAIAAFVTGFVTILMLQIFATSLAFPWQLCVGTAVAFLTCASITSEPTAHAAKN